MDTAPLPIPKENMSASGEEHQIQLLQEIANDLRCVNAKLFNLVTLLNYIHQTLGRQTTAPATPFRPGDWSVPSTEPLHPGTATPQSPASWPESGGTCEGGGCGPS